MQKKLSAYGFSVLGGFNLSKQEQDAHQNFKSILLIGNLGDDFWPEFSKWREAQPPNLSNPLNQWTKSILDALAHEMGVKALYPFDVPYHPFQQWALRACPDLSQSPLGLLIHRQYGMWFGLRAAFLSIEKFDGVPAISSDSPCASCVDKPCLSACPVNAFQEQNYDVPVCKNYLTKPPNPCMDGFCLARRACPIGKEHIYQAATANFFMRSFIK